MTAWLKTGPAALALGLLLTVGAAQAAVGPFAALAGTWAGSGTITMSNGGQEGIRCRASYAVAPGGSNLRLNIRCASDSYNFDLDSDVAHNGGAITGEWRETSRNASGTVSGRAAGDSIQVVARSDLFTASLTLTTRGNHQSVAIRPQGTDVSAVSIALNRR